MSSRRLLRQFLSFALIGVLGTATHFLVLYALVSLLGLGPLAGSSLGALAGALVNYGLNYRLTFRSRRKHRDALPRFAVVAGGGWLLNGALMAILLSRLDIHYLLVQVIVSGIVLVWNFLANRFWTFSEG
ncbi:MAG: GtrA family protein [Candidatus Accumulibacter sp.]|nr:GtrA family protein [Accumulibacter sp.]